MRNPAVLNIRYTSENLLFFTTLLLLIGIPSTDGYIPTAFTEPDLDPNMCNNNL